MDKKKVIRTILFRLLGGLFVGVSIIAVALIVGRENVDVVLPTYVCALILAIGLFLIASALIRQKRVENNYNEPVECLCVEWKEVTLITDGRIRRQKVPVYRFTLDSTEYTVSEEAMGAYAQPPEPGESRTLMIDRNNPEKYADPDEDRNAVGRAIRTAIPLLAIAVVLFVVFRFSPKINACFAKPAG